MSGLSSAENALVAAIDPAPILANTLDWAAINSGSGNLAGLARMAGLLADAFSALPGTITLATPAPVTSIGADGLPAPVATGQHLTLSVRPDAFRRVLLTGHMDTVFAEDDPFQTCRWLDPETLNGPGAADMKGGLALLLAALTAFETGRPSLGYDLVINADEETGSLSSTPLIRDLARGKLAALTYEPALPDGAMAGARPGSGNYAAVVRGRPAHAGRNPEDGRNAIVAAADLALRLNGERHAGLAVNPARIEGGAALNTVPELAVMRFNLRPETPEDAIAAEAMLARVIAEVAAAHDVAIHLHGAITRPPKPMDPASERLFALVGRAAADLGQNWLRRDTGGVCDGNTIAACGIPVIDTMGALGGAIHSPGEFLITSGLAPRAALTALALHRLDQGETP